MRDFLKRTLAASRLGDAVAYFFGIILITFTVAWVGPLLNWALARQQAWIGTTFVVLTSVLLVLFAALMINERFLRDVHGNGLKWPSLLSIGLGWAGITVFGGVSCAFQRAGVVEIEPTVALNNGCATKYADMYLWDMFNLIPAIKFNETIGWEQRYQYSDALSGWLMLLFKVLVVVAVIGSFISAGRIRREQEKQTTTSPPVPKSAEAVAEDRVPVHAG